MILELVTAVLSQFYCQVDIALPEQGPVYGVGFLPGVVADRPHGLTVQTGVDGKVILPVKFWGWSTNLSFITADVDKNGFTNGEDSDLFRGWFIAGDDRADFDGNDFVNGEDLDLFNETFASGK